VETVWGGDEECEHIWSDEIGQINRNESSGVGAKQGMEASQGNFCQKCGAWKGQLGLEPNPNLYVKHLMEIFNELKKVLKPTGLFFLNIGDTYSRGSRPKDSTEDSLRKENDSEAGEPDFSIGYDLPDKCMSMIPERVMMAMVDNGWILRNKIVWNKPNPMPESVKDRFSTGYEVVYMFSLNKQYYFDLDAVREPHEATSSDYERKITDKDKGLLGEEGLPDNMSSQLRDREKMENHPKGKNPGDVWDITTKPFPKAHFAVYPPELCEKPIKAGCPKKVCAECGKPYERKEPEKEKINTRPGNNTLQGKSGSESDPNKSLHKREISTKRQKIVYRPKGYKKTCDCNTDETKKGVVLDPLVGAGTTCLAARKHNRNYIGIEISQEYVEMAKNRIRKEVGGQPLDRFTDDRK